MIKRLLTLLIAFTYLLPIKAETDAYIKLYDHHNTHPRIESITFPGNANTLDMYNSIYGHGAVIENPWVAFRVYMDNRQSLDLYVKQTPRKELDITGFYTTPDQLAEGYGCDVLWAGQSIGAGSFRGWQNDMPVTIDTVALRTQSVLNDHSIVMADKAWRFNSHDIDMTQVYSMKPDARDLWVEITLEGAEDADLFCCGVQKLEKDNRGFIDDRGFAASWGSNVPDKARPEIEEQVGLAIEVDSANIVRSLETDLNYLFIVRPDNNGKIRYRVLAAGDRERNGFKSAQNWFDYVTSHFTSN
ncbi:MAG: DUF4861 domain-containing protein [Muribaculaceae bacterium]|nr:DUF4861 domain-containing protein [Muribaculaceae bacterium]